MRQFFFFLLFAIAQTSMVAQEVGDIIEFTTDIPVKSQPVGVYPNQKLLYSSYKTLDSGVKFRVIEKANGAVKLRALNYNPLSKKRNNLKSWQIDKSEYYNNLYFSVAIDDFLKYAELVENKDRLSIGLLTLPFKIRPQKEFSYDTEFNFNSTLNVRLGAFYGSSFNLQVGAGIGSVGLNSANSTGLGVSEAQDVATLTLLSGLMLQYKKVQFGVYGGVDYINNQVNYGWKSHGDIWIGFGIGYNLFNITLSERKVQQ